MWMLRSELCRFLLEFVILMLGKINFLFLWLNAFFSLCLSLIIFLSAFYYLFLFSHRLFSLFLFSSNLSVFLSLFSLTIYCSPICSSGNTDETTSEELACRYIIWLTPLNLPQTLILFPVSHTVTWQSAQQRCDCWSNSSRSNTKRLLIFIKSSSSHWSFFCKSIIREQCVENVSFL